MEFFNLCSVYSWYLSFSDGIKNSILIFLYCNHMFHLNFYLIIDKLLFSFQNGKIFFDPCLKHSHFWRERKKLWFRLIFHDGRLSQISWKILPIILFVHKSDKTNRSEGPGGLHRWWVKNELVSKFDGTGQILLL